jgi:hypothetical protein
MGSDERGDFWVHYEIARQPRRSVTPDHEPWSLNDIINGFWITEDYRLCRISQGKWFIPASRIILVERR